MLSQHQDSIHVWFTNNFKTNTLNNLLIVLELFEQWSDNNVNYCHWKSNQHLAEALSGETDLDILVDRNDARKCEEILHRLNFRRVVSPFWCRYPNIYDWIGFDPESGKLCHIHLHYKIIIGKKNIKNIHLPIESWLLTDKRLHNNVYLPEHEKELIIFIIRVTLKTSIFQLLNSSVKRISPLPQNIQQECNWLLSSYNEAKLISALSKSDIKVPLSFFIDFIEHIRNNDLTIAKVLRAKIFIRSFLGSFRLKSDFYVFLRWIYVHLYLKVIVYFDQSTKKTFPDHGQYFAIVGSDGSGKTTLSSDIKKWLSWKVALKHIYFGLPKRSVLLRFINLFKLPFIYLSGGSPLFNKPIVFLDNIWWLYIAYRRVRLHKLCLKYRNLGYIVIAERFPLKEFWSMSQPMDGPRIKEQGLFLKWEQNLYNKIQLPDKIFVLQLSIEEIRKRKDNLDFYIHQRKVKAINSIKPKKKYLLINAEQPYEDVLHFLKSNIWKSL